LSFLSPRDWPDPSNFLSPLSPRTGS